MNVRLRRNETPAWAAWVSARYRSVPVRHRRGIHLALPGKPFTLCMRSAEGHPATDGYLCPTCRAVSRASYAMNTAPKVGPDRNRGIA